MMQIQHKEENGKGIFFGEENGDKIGELVYTIPSAGKIIIEHTEVDDSLTGKGLGTQLVEAAVNHARTNNIKIIPQCSFAKSIIGLKPEWHDILAKPMNLK